MLRDEFCLGKGAISSILVIAYFNIHITWFVDDILTAYYISTGESLLLIAALTFRWSLMATVATAR